MEISKPIHFWSHHSWHQLDHMQIICTLLQTDNHASTFHSVFTGWMPFLLPNKQHQSTKTSLLSTVAIKSAETYVPTTRKTTTRTMLRCICKAACNAAKKPISILYTKLYNCSKVWFTEINPKWYMWQQLIAYA